MFGFDWGGACDIDIETIMNTTVLVLTVPSLPFSETDLQHALLYITRLVSSADTLYIRKINCVVVLAVKAAQ